MIHPLFLTTVLFFVSAVGITLGGIYLMRRIGNVRGSKSMQYFLGVICLYSLCSALRLVAPLEIARPLVEFGLVWGFLFSIAFFVFASAYTGRSIHKNTAYRYGMGVVVGAVIILTLTNSSHHLLWTEGVQMASEPFSHAYMDSESWTSLYGWTIGLAYVQYAIGLYYLIVMHMKSDYRSDNTIFLILGALSPVALNLASIADVLPISTIDYTPIGAAFYGIMLVGAVYDDLYRFSPLARATVLENTSQGIIVLSRDWSIRDYNEAAADLYPSVETTKQVDDVLNFTEEFEWDVSDGEETTEVSVQKDGDTRSYKVSCTPVVDDPHHLGWAIVFSDITDIRKSQQELERHNEQLDRFSRAVMHYLRNPTTVTIGYSEMISKECDRIHEEVGDGELNEVVLDSIDTIQDFSETVCDAGERLNKNVDDLLALTEHGKTIDATEEVNLQEAISPFTKQDVDVEVEEDGTIIAEPGRLSLLFENIIANASYRRDGDAKVTVGVVQDQMYFEDNGSPISDSEVEKIFRYDAETKTERNPINLSLVKMVAEAHGWKVHADTSYGKGLRVVFEGVTSTASVDGTATAITD